MVAEKRFPKTRRIDFGFPKADAPTKYFADDSIFLSHMLAGLSAIFPPGEDIFIRSVRRYMSLIDDPDLKKRASGFIGQEKVHGNQHRDLNAQLTEMGYPTTWFENLLSITVRLEKYLDTKYPDPHQLVKIKRFFLGFTVTAEHFTAVLAEKILTSPEAQAMMYDPDIKNLLNWHALEELEHKSVAFDVFRALDVPESTRIRWMYFAQNCALPLIVLGTWVSVVAKDREGRRHPIRVFKEMVRALRGPLFTGFYTAMTPFNKPNFHPDQIDTNAVMIQWQQELFGTEGTLIDNLK